MLHLAYLAGILSKVVARRRTRRCYRVVSCRAPQTYFYHFWSLYVMCTCTKNATSVLPWSLVLTARDGMEIREFWLMYVEGLAEEVDGSESFPSCNVCRSEKSGLKLCRLMSFEAGTNNFFEQANTKSSLTLSWKLHFTKHLITFSCIHLALKKRSLPVLCFAHLRLTLAKSKG